MSSRKFERIGECGVDSGQLMILDPCYAKYFNGLVQIHKLLDEFGKGEIDAYQMAKEMSNVIESHTEYKFTKGIKRKSDGRQIACFSKVDGVTITYASPLKEFGGKSMNDLLATDEWEGFSDSPYDIGDFNYGGACHTRHNGQNQLGRFLGVVVGTKYGDGIYEVKGRRDADGDICEIKIKL